LAANATLPKARGAATKIANPVRLIILFGLLVLVAISKVYSVVYSN
jgi:hypothetical protein